MANFLGVTIKTLRNNAGYSQEELARKCSMSTSHICKIEVADVPLVGKNSLKKLASVLEVDADKLILLAGKTPAVVLDRCRKSLEFTDFLLWAATLSDTELTSIKSSLAK